jgi:hypothetical protein
LHPGSLRVSPSISLHVLLLPLLLRFLPLLLPPH